MKSFLTVCLQCIVALTFAQKSEKPFIRLTQPLKETNTVAAARQFIIGSSCKNCTVTVNAVPVKVYSTGAFVYELNLTP
jgi:N-acetylmuramoyl-L-alanine amidase